MCQNEWTDPVLSLQTEQHGCFGLRFPLPVKFIAFQLFDIAAGNFKDMSKTFFSFYFNFSFLMQLHLLVQASQCGKKPCRTISAASSVLLQKYFHQEQSFVFCDSRLPSAGLRKFYQPKAPFTQIDYALPVTSSKVLPSCPCIPWPDMVDLIRSDWLLGFW